MPSESTLTQSLAALIRQRGGWAKKTHGGPSMAGWLDIHFFYRGYGGALEVKLPGKENTLTKLQQETINQLKAAGAIASMVTSRSEVNAILDRIDAVKDKKK